MGYRSCVAILMYGEKQDCEMVMNLFSYRDWETDRKSTRLNSSH